MAHLAARTIPRGAGFLNILLLRGIVLSFRVFFCHPVTDADLGKDVDRLCRIRFDLASDICHGDPQDGIVVLGIGPPDMFDQPVIEQNFSAVSGKKGDDLELVLGQMDLDRKSVV